MPEPTYIYFAEVINPYGATIHRSIHSTDEKAEEAVDRWLNANREALRDPRRREQYATRVYSLPLMD